MLVPLSASGITLERSLLTRFAVACSAGPVVATALKKAVVPAWLIWTGETAATPGVCETSFSSVCSRGSLARGSLPDEPWELAEPPEEAWAGEPSDTATSSGPLVPGPKLSEIRSYARRAVVDVDSAATSFCPRVSDSSGIASGMRIARAARAEITGRLTTPVAHRAHRPCFE